MMVIVTLRKKKVKIKIKHEIHFRHYRKNNYNRG